MKPFDKLLVALCVLGIIWCAWFLTTDPLNGLQGGDIVNAKEP